MKNFIKIVKTLTQFLTQISRDCGKISYRLSWLLRT